MCRQDLPFTKVEEESSTVEDHNRRCIHCGQRRLYHYRAEGGPMPFGSCPAEFSPSGGPDPFRDPNATAEDVVKFFSQRGTVFKAVPLMPCWKVQAQGFLIGAERPMKFDINTVVSASSMEEAEASAIRHMGQYYENIHVITVEEIWRDPLA